MSVPIRLRRGDDFLMSVEWLDAALAPIPIASARLQARRAPDAEPPMMTLTDADDLTIGSGRVDIHIRPDVSQLLESGVWDIEVTSVSGVKKTLAAGRLYIDRDVTRG